MSVKKIIYVMSICICTCIFFTTATSSTFAASPKTSNKAVKIADYKGSWTNVVDNSGDILEITNIKGNTGTIELITIWYMGKNGESSREAHSDKVKVTFNEKGIGYFKFTDDWSGEEGKGTIILKTDKVLVYTSYPEDSNAFLFKHYINNTNQPSILKRSKQ